MSARVPASVNALVVVSDLHVGCQLGLCDPAGARLDSGGTYQPSAVQHKVYAWWREFWDTFVPLATKGDPYAVCVNGDIVDGVHHNATTQWSHNMADQAEMAIRILEPVVKQCHGRFYIVRGTESHVGQAAEHEERLARHLHALPNAEGQYARYELWKRVGPRTVHCLHHLGGTGSQFYESTALHKEVIESLTEAGRWGRQYPDVVVRSHRHRYIETVIPSDRGRVFGVVTPAWQLKTAYAWRIAGARLSEPQVGGIVIRWHKDELYIRPWVRSLGRGASE